MHARTHKRTHTNAPQEHAHTNKYPDSNHTICNARYLPRMLFLQHVEIDADNKVGLHQLTNLLESVIDDQSDGKLENTGAKHWTPVCCSEIQ